MNDKIHEVMNEYIDGNLNSVEIDQFNKELENNPELAVKLKGLKVVDSYMKTMEADKAPLNITEKVMQRINAAFSSKLPKSYFPAAFGGLFASALVALIIFFFTYFSAAKQEYPAAEKSVNVVTNYLTDIIGKFSGQLVSADIMLIVSIVTLVVMLSFYFLFESHKAYKKKLDSITN